MAPAHRTTPAKLRARIAELRIPQWRVANRLVMSEVHLSHILVERKPADDLTLARIAKAIEDVASAEASGAGGIVL